MKRMNMGVLAVAAVLVQSPVSAVNVLGGKPVTAHGVYGVGGWGAGSWHLSTASQTGRSCPRGPNGTRIPYGGMPDDPSLGKTSW